MQPYESKFRQLIRGLAIAIVIVIVSPVIPVHGGELRPLPPYQRPGNRVISPAYYDYFYQQIQGLGCPELRELRRRLDNDHANATTGRERDYYYQLIIRVDRVMIQNRCR
jgi:hypothetical protein